MGLQLNLDGINRRRSVHRRMVAKTILQSVGKVKRSTSYLGTLVGMGSYTS